MISVQDGSYSYLKDHRSRCSCWIDKLSSRIADATEEKNIGETVEENLMIKNMIWGLVTTKMKTMDIRGSQVGARD